MKWFSHDSDANQDAKLQNVLLDYGLEGYGLYWYCIELITNKIDKDSVTFELEHDARIIARNTGSTPQKVEEMMRYFVKEGLFESIEGVITCFKLAKRLNKSMTSNPQMREIIGKLKSHDSVMTESQIVMQDHITLDNNTTDKITPLVQPEAKPKKVKSKYKFNDYQMQFAEWMYGLILKVNPTFSKPNFEDWANTIRLMMEVNERDGDHMVQVFTWANGDSFWSSNIQSPSKFRKQFDALTAKMNGCSNSQPKEAERTQEETQQMVSEMDDLYARSQASKARREARELK